MPNDRPQPAKVEAILAAAEKMARRNHQTFVVDDAKRDDFLKFSAALRSDIENSHGREHNQESQSFR